MVRQIATPSVTDPTVKDLALELGRTPATLRSWMKAEGLRRTSTRAWRG